MTTINNVSSNKKAETFIEEKDKEWIADTFNRISDCEDFLRYALIERSFSIPGFTDEDREELVSMANKLNEFQNLAFKLFEDKYVCITWNYGMVVLHVWKEQGYNNDCELFSVSSIS